MPYDGLQRMPGIGTEDKYDFRRVLYGTDGVMRLPHVGIIDASESNDPLNSDHKTTLRPGLLMGKITSSGLWAPSIVGLTTAAYTSGGTTLTVSAATAIELDRLVGQSGTNELVCIGAPTATGTVAVTAFTHSAIDTSTGAITVTSLGVNKHSGAFVAVNDGRYTPRGILDEGYGIRVIDNDADRVDVALQSLLIGGLIDTGQVINYPAAANTGLITWLKDNIKGVYAWKDDFIS